MAKGKARPTGRADETLGFLLNDAARAVRRTWGPMITRHGVSTGIFPFLRIVFERDDLTVRELAEAVHMRGPTTVNIVKQMEALGFVRRERNAVDARKINISLTAAGRRAWEAALPEVISLNARAESGLSVTEKRELKRLLRHVRANFDDLPVKGT
jgi:MarR family transcriptional regulator, organic hydroperoxide resistance regulator